MPQRATSGDRRGSVSANCLSPEINVIHHHPSCDNCGRIWSYYSRTYTQWWYVCRPVMVLFLAGRIVWLPGVVPIICTRNRVMHMHRQTRSGKIGIPMSTAARRLRGLPKGRKHWNSFKNSLFSQSHYTSNKRNMFTKVRDLHDRLKLSQKSSWIRYLAGLAVKFVWFNWYVMLCVTNANLMRIFAYLRLHYLSCFWCINKHDVCTVILLFFFFIKHT